MNGINISMKRETIEKYLEKREQLLPKLRAFMDGKQPYLIVQSVPLDVYCNCNSIDSIYDSNIKFFERQLSVKSDWLPYLEPWIGTGVYANAFGCEYLWREGTSPAVHYKYRSLNELKYVDKPNINDSPIMKTVLDIIKCFRERVGDNIPIALTDTQSANDTATMILDAVEFMTGCYEKPDIISQFLKKINDLVIEFSKVQIDAIGNAPVARPGHIMVSDQEWRGISISDDNLAIVSPSIGREFCLKYDQELADEFDGLAIHSCGKWQHLMPDVARMRKIIGIDCAVHLDSDPNPNDPEAVRDAFVNTGIAVKVRGPATIEPWIDILPRLAKDGLKIIVQLQYIPDENKSSENYDKVDNILSNIYGG